MAGELRDSRKDVLRLPCQRRSRDPKTCGDQWIPCNEDYRGQQGHRSHDGRFVTGQALWLGPVGAIAAVLFASAMRVRAPHHRRDLGAAAVMECRAWGMLGCARLAPSWEALCPQTMRLCKAPRGLARFAFMSILSGPSLVLPACRP